MSVTSDAPLAVKAGFQAYVFETVGSVSANKNVEGFGFAHSEFKVYHSEGTLSV